MKLRRIADFGPAFILLMALLTGWEVYVRSGQISPRVLPMPTAIIQALRDNREIIFVHTLQTSLETVIGLTVATLLGVALAILLDISLLMRRAVYPLLVISQTVPMIALAPLLLIWFGFDLGPKVMVVVLYCFFPIAVACADGLLGADPDLMRLLRSMHASRWQMLWLVRLPGAMPAFFSGLRIAATYSVTAAIFGEFVGGYQGLGIYMLTSAKSYVPVLVFAAIVVTTILSLLLFGFVSLIERIALPYATSARPVAKDDVQDRSVA